MEIIELGEYVAAVDVLTGNGLLAMPDPSSDVLDPFAGGEELHEAGLDAALTRLYRMGIEPSEDEDGYPFAWEAPLPDGRPVVGLYVREPIMSKPSMEDIAACLSVPVERAKHRR